MYLDLFFINREDKKKIGMKPHTNIRKCRLSRLFNIRPFYSIPDKMGWLYFRSDCLMRSCPIQCTDYFPYPPWMLTKQSSWYVSISLGHLTLHFHHVSGDQRQATFCCFDEGRRLLLHPNLELFLEDVSCETNCATSLP
jgi:hypothetical protein